MEHSEVILKIPAGHPYQLVYRMERSDPFVDGAPAGVQLTLLSSPSQILRLAAGLWSWFGLSGLVKTCLKLLARDRFLYVAQRDGRVVHSGWLRVGQCRHYPVGANEVVIGPVATASECRGMGIATAALRYAVNRMLAQGHTAFYIDTAGDNFSMQKVIAKCAFGAPIACNLRDPVTGDLF